MTSNRPAGSAVDSKICRHCGKTVRKDSKGSITSWLFSSGQCRCDRDGAAQDDDPIISSTRSGVYKTLRMKLAGAATQLQAERMAAQHMAGQSKLSEKILEKYEFVSLLGEGGMGNVYLVKERITGKLFALKLVRQELIADGRSIQQFDKEATAIRKLVHPNLVSMYDHAAPLNEAPYLVMDYVEGINLAALIEEHGRLLPSEVLQIFIQVCAAIEHAHSKGVLHCDIKPSNIIINEDKDNYVKVIDFGIAKLITGQPHLTQDSRAGELIGTPEYMSPEYCRSERLDARSDIYSIGCVMFESLCGQPPYTNKNKIKLILDHVNTPVPQLNKAFPELGIPSSLSAVVQRCMQKRTEDRYQSVTDLRQTLESLAMGKRVRKSLPPCVPQGVLLAGAICACLCIGAAAIFATANRQDSRQQAAVQKVIQDDLSSDPLSTKDLNQVCSDKSMRVLKLNVTRFDNNKLAPIGELKQLRELNLSGTNVDDRIFPYLLQLPLLNSVHLSSTNITAKGARLIGQMPQVETLGLAQNDAIASALDSYDHLSKLRDLTLSDTDFKDADVPKLLKLPSLRILNLDRCNIHDAALRKIVLLPLRRLEVGLTNITDASLPALAQCSHLRALKLAGDNITDEGVSKLRELPYLAKLNLLHTKITPASAKSLATIKSLRELYVDPEILRSPEFVALRKELPKCVFNDVNHALDDMRDIRKTDR